MSFEMQHLSLGVSKARLQNFDSPGFYIFTGPKKSNCQTRIKILLNLYSSRYSYPLQNQYFKININSF